MIIFYSGADESHGSPVDKVLFTTPVMTTYLKAREEGTQRQRRFLGFHEARKQEKEQRKK